MPHAPLLPPRCGTDFGPVQLDRTTLHVQATAAATSHLSLWVRFWLGPIGFRLPWAVVMFSGQAAIPPTYQNWTPGQHFISNISTISCTLAAILLPALLTLPCPSNLVLFMFINTLPGVAASTSSLGPLLNQLVTCSKPAPSPCPQNAYPLTSPRDSMVPPQA